MKRKNYLTIMVVLSISIIMLQATASASASDLVRSNAYIARTSAMIERASGGRLNIFFSITGMGKMDELGATMIYLYENNGTTNHIAAVYSYVDSDYSAMMGGNSSYHGGNIPYTGTPGYQYYAIVYFRAGNSTGSGSTVFTTATVTALP